MDVRQIDALEFHTSRLLEVRRFYGELLGLPQATIERDGQAVPQVSERYACYRLGATDLAFTAAPISHVANLIFGTGDLDALLARLEAGGLEVARGEGGWATLRDPDGREITLQGWES